MHSAGVLPVRPARRRILITADAVGGVWTYTVTLARALARHGDTVLVVTLGPPPSSTQHREIAAVGALTGGSVRLHVTDLALEWMDPEGRDLDRARETLAAIARAFRPDIVHLGGFREATADVGVPVLVVAHSCVRTWWRACRGGVPDDPRWRVYADHVAAGLAAADAWAAPTRALRDAIADLYAPPRPGVVIPNGVAVPPADDPPPERRSVILAAGRLWDEAKGLDTLLGAAPRLPWPVRLAGDTASPDGGAPIALPDGVTALGRLDRAALLAEMRAAELFVAPARYEPFGLGIAEAAACGAALVLSDIASLRELWDGAAAFVPPDDPAALAATLTALCADAPRRRALQAAARRRATRYGADAMVNRIETVHAALAACRVAPTNDRAVAGATIIATGGAPA
ncbi:Phosphatidyl-myo-inositol mannosyltransferase [Rhodoplanes serenus]|uniref:Phosphatidyl-myo-inositol mannosyltransferase n=1 Tax=Rhodoplanes serenus TaxID=200615 RepID=A0A3S4BGP7_9BRAD|nr:glycosyltransferase family 4 protein [Rhodoplanes serenus]VCU09448.1 Phosphatidyl-myo-inositol mannosyltransferase [Rhodoplanes serenus]